MGRFKWHIHSNLDLIRGLAMSTILSNIIRMKKTVFLRGLIWLYLMGFGYMMALALEPGYLDFDNLPDTNFTCVGKVIGGYYADLETNCQMFHVCTIGQLDEPMDIRFLCLNGTVFDQETRVCERIDEVDCSKSEQFYSLNLELYGNTQPPIAEESPDTDPPIVIKKSTTTTTTTSTTTTARPKPKTTRQRFFITTSSPSPVTTSVTKVISTHHFPISSRPDIRFNPEEINISLNPGAPPSIRHQNKPVSFQQQIFDKKAIVDFDSTKEVPVQVQKPKIVSTSQKPTKSVYNNPEVTPGDINYGFTYHHHLQQQPDDFDEDDYRTEDPHHHNYQYHHQFRPGLSQQFHNSHFKSTTYRSDLSPTTRKSIYDNHKGVTTYRSPFVSLRPSQSYQFKTEQPQKLQLPLPLIPNLSFSSPAPFALTRHVETKRYTHDHVPPPRIIISASASVSDASGRRLNYSLGTIGVAPLLEQPPKSYDDYKDHDVVLDPFYHDVPKVAKSDRRRKRRSAQTLKHSDVIRNEQEAVDVLKFLFDWYKSQQRSTTIEIPVLPEDVTEINDELSTGVEAPSTSSDFDDFRTSSLFKRGSRFNIVGDVLSITTTEKEQNESEVSTHVNNVALNGSEYEYVDDNYEPLAYEDQYNDTDLRNESNLTEDVHNDNYEEIAKNSTQSSSPSLSEEVTKNSTTVEVPSDGYYESLKEIEDSAKIPVASTTSELPEDDNLEKHEEQPTQETPKSTTYEDSSVEVSTESALETTTETSEVIIILVKEPTSTTEKYEGPTSLSTPSTTEEIPTSIEADFNENPTDSAIIPTSSAYEEVENKTAFEEINSSDEHFDSSVPPTTSESEESTATTEMYEETTKIEENSPETTRSIMLEENSEIYQSSTTTTESSEIFTTTSASVEIENLTPVEVVTEQIVTTTRKSPRRGYNRRTRPTSAYRKARPTNRHRFSTPNFTPRPHRRKSTIEDEIIETISGHSTTTEVSTTQQLESVENTSSKEVEEVSATDAPLYKSVNPTLGEVSAKVTTPLSLTYRVQVRRAKVGKAWVFNCFGRRINRFYSDPRDCRLFHYCTAGYTKNQLLDMKFVCDFGTYFDEEALVCAKSKPKRCL